MSTGAVILLVIVVLLVLGAGAWFVLQQSRRRRLRQRFGPEYDRRIEETDDRRVAERELTEREKRHASFNLRALSEQERARYTEQWTVVQEQFVDRPGEAVVAAEQLVQSVMRDRGYPTEDFEQQASDLSVDHAPAVDSYRSGYDIRIRHERAGVSTEELRQGLMHYRAVFVSVAGIRGDGEEDRTDHTDRAPGQSDADPAVDRAYQAGRADAGTHGPDGPDGTARTDVAEGVPTDAGNHGRRDGTARTDVPEGVPTDAGNHQVVDEPRRTNS